MTAYRLVHCAGRSNVGVPVASAVTISPRGDVFDAPTVTEPGPTGEHALMVWHNAIIDEPLAAYLVRHGQGHRLRPLKDSEIASPRTEAVRFATPQHIAHWYAAEVEAGRLIPPEEFPPPAVRRQLREAQGLSRPAVGELVAVSGEAVRLWETGDREPTGEARGRYRDLLTSWLSGPQEPAQEPADPDPAGQPGVQPHSGPLTNAGHKEALTAAMRAHKARMRTVRGRPGYGSWPPAPAQPRSIR